MEKIVERNMLYDFYGELLTPHQQEIYESIIFQDLSLSEVAEIHGCLLYTSDAADEL